MTKTLTEQWREGTLDGGWYYIKIYWGAGYDIIFDNYNPTTGLFVDFGKEVKEVLAPVPSYDEYKELVRKSDKLDKIMYDSATNQGDCQQIVEDNLNRQIERLQEQLNEANEVIKKYTDYHYELNNKGKMVYKEKNTASKYLEKWGVK